MFISESLHYLEAFKCCQAQVQVQVQGQVQVRSQVRSKDQGLKTWAWANTGSLVTWSLDLLTDRQAQPFIVKDKNHDIAIAMSSSSHDDTAFYS